MQDHDELIGTSDACRILDIHPATLGRWVASGRLAPASKLPKKNGAYVFRRGEVERVQEKRQAERVVGEVRAEMARQQIGKLQLGQGTGLTQNKLSRRLVGAVPFSTSDLEKIAAFLGVPIGQLVDPPVREVAS